jgi:hypothetical protein
VGAQSARASRTVHVGGSGIEPPMFPSERDSRVHPAIAESCSANSFSSIDDRLQSDRCDAHPRRFDLDGMRLRG